MRFLLYTALEVSPCLPSLNTAPEEPLMTPSYKTYVTLLGKPLNTPEGEYLMTN